MVLFLAMPFPRYSHCHWILLITLFLGAISAVFQYYPGLSDVPMMYDWCDTFGLGAVRNTIVSEGILLAVVIAAALYKLQSKEIDLGNKVTQKDTEEA